MHPASGPSKAVTGAAGPRGHEPSDGGPTVTGRQRENDSEASRKERRHELESDAAATDASR